MLPGYRCIRLLLSRICQNGDISADGSDYKKVKKALIEQFAPVESPEVVILVAMAARFSFGYHGGYLRNETVPTRRWDLTTRRSSDYLATP